MAPTSKHSRRGSPEVIAKHRSARILNTLFCRGTKVARVDARTLRRKRRLVRELQDGRRGEPLKPVEVLAHVTELLRMGETLRSVRELGPRLPALPPLSVAFLAAVRETQASFGFDPRAWRLLGIDIGRLSPTGGEADEELVRRRRRRGRSVRERGAA